MDTGSHERASRKKALRDLPVRTAQRCGCSNPGNPDGIGHRSSLLPIPRRFRGFRCRLRAGRHVAAPGHRLRSAANIPRAARRLALQDVQQAFHAKKALRTPDAICVPEAVAGHGRMIVQTHSLPTKLQRRECQRHSAAHRFVNIRGSRRRTPASGDRFRLPAAQHCPYAGHLARAQYRQSSGKELGRTAGHAVHAEIRARGSARSG